jgi:hypothetical protein
MGHPLGQAAREMTLNRATKVGSLPAVRSDDGGPIVSMLTVTDLHPPGGFRRR